MENELLSDNSVLSPGDLPQSKACFFLQAHSFFEEDMYK